MQGRCLDKVTGDFPTFSLKDAEKTIRDSYMKSGGDFGELPCLPDNVGGEVDIMVGIKYLKYFPEQIHKLPSGLTIYEAAFSNYDGSRGIVAGPHASFTKDWEQVGQVAYSYSAGPVVPQPQGGIVKTSLEAGEEIEPNHESIPATTLRVCVPIGGNDCQGTEVQLPVEREIPGADLYKYSAQLQVGKIEKLPPVCKNTKKQGVRFYTYSPQQNECETPFWDGGRLQGTESVGRNHPRYECPPFWTTCLICWAGGTYFSSKPTCKRPIYMVVACQGFFPQFWCLAHSCIVCQSYCPTFASICLSYWTGRPPSEHI